MTVIDDLRKELLPILNGISTSPAAYDNEQRFKTILSDKSLFFSNEIAGPYRRTLKTLMLIANRSGKLVSDKALEEKLVNFLSKLKYDDHQEKVRNEIDKHIVEFIDSIKKNEIKQIRLSSSYNELNH